METPWNERTLLIEHSGRRRYQTRIVVGTDDWFSGWGTVGSERLPVAGSDDMHEKVLDGILGLDGRQQRIRIRFVLWENIEDGGDTD